jgi:phosphomannomutase/phosphoglucomutase
VAKSLAANKKKAANQAPSDGNNKTVLSYFYVPILTMAITIAAGAFFLIRTQVNPVNQEHQQILIEEIAKQYEAYFNNVLDQHDILMEQIASSDYVLEQLTNADVSAAESAIASQVPNGLAVHVFALRQAELKPNATPPFSHAAMDMIRRAEQGQEVVLEAHQSAGVVYLQSVKAIRNGSGRIVGTVSISQSIDYLAQQLKGIDPSNGNLLVQQQFLNAPIQTLLTYGAKNSNEVIKLASNNINWTITFQPSNDLSYASIQSPSIFILVFGILAVIAALPFILASQRVQTALRQDANAFARQVQNLLTGQSQAPADFELAIFSTLEKTLNRMRLGKGLKLPTGAPPVAQGTSETKYNSDGNDSFDVSMMDSDNDLLGMNQSANSNTNHIAVSEELFHSYDIRGIVGQTLTNDAAVQIGIAVGSEAFDRGQQTVIVGRDGRLSSPELTQALIRGLRSSGRDVIDIGEVPTPVCYFACQHLDVGTCIMVTGSHNPANHNGFRVVIAGNALIEDEIKGLYHRIENQNFLKGDGKLMTQDISSAYLDKIKSDVKPERALKIVIDCGNGIAGSIAPQLIKNIGCHVLPLYCEVDGNFPNHLPDPGDPRNLEDLARTVVETRADLGVAFDGDGDRISIVTNSGKVVYSDRLLMLLAKQVVQANPGATILFDVKSSRRLKNLILGFGGKPVMWKTGHSFIKRRMKEVNAALAGEMSGHIFYQDRWFGFDDGLYATARLLEIIAGQGETLDNLLNELPQDISTPELTIESTDARKFRVVEALQRNGQFGNGQLTDIDGVRVDFQDGWGLVRASNTRPKLSCRFEADNEESLKKIQTLFKQQLLAVDSQLQIPF